MASMSVFVAEGNVEIYLSQLHNTWSPEDRDTLLRLLVREEDQMGSAREHLENGERRVKEGRERIAKHRQTMAESALQQQSHNPAALLLETLEQTQMLLEQHLATLQRRREIVRL